MQDILQRIEKNLYEIETILTTETIVKLLSDYKIDDKKFLDTINFYIKHYEVLEHTQEIVLLKMLDEKLNYFSQNSQNNTTIKLYHEKLATCITFIQNKLHILIPQKMELKNKQTTEQISCMPIDKIVVKDFFSIKKIELSNLQNKREIYIVGENGDGKTLLLQAIAISLKDSQEDGQGVFRKIKDTFSLELTLENNLDFNLEKHNYQNFFAYGSNRNNSCKMEVDKTGYLTLFDTSLDLHNPIDWLIELYNAEKSNKKTVITLEKAKEILISLLYREISIDVSYNHVEFKEKNSMVEFEQLSAGYKSIIILICDLLIRLEDNQPDIQNIQEFKGIVLIDEMELHLHPKWKYAFMNKLREYFPLIQFIVTTHSPTVLLGASKQAVFYKIYKEEGEVKISEQIKNEGYSSNTIISSPLFDLGTMKSEHYSNRELSEDDYIYSKIHKVVSQRAKEDIDMSEEELLTLIDIQLSKELKNL